MVKVRGSAGLLGQVPSGDAVLASPSTRGGASITTTGIGPEGWVGISAIAPQWAWVQ